jgi:hypothetical protein
MTSKNLSSTDQLKSQCSSLSDGESFECFGENDQLTNIENNNSEKVADRDLPPNG